MPWRRRRSRASTVSALTGLTGVVVLVWPLGPAFANSETYRLQLTGDGETAIPLDGEVPYEQALVGLGLSCKIHAEGRVVVEIEYGGSRTRSATSNGTINVSLR